MRSIRELAIYGMKGAAAYAFHAAILGFHDDAIYDFLVRSLAAMNRVQSEDELEQMAIETGRIMIAAMALLDQANVECTACLKSRTFRWERATVPASSLPDTT